mmetsp:Transcript_4438/g.5143  ORF Transcript_4438/g.5143 Transcript_4438/m.5143 type:complete len:458 (-) Transcript_4438:29-1402(-)
MSSVSSKSVISAFLVGSVVTLTMTTLWNRKKKTALIKNEIGFTCGISQELREEQLLRYALNFGGDGMQIIRNLKIVIVGVGGVGSHTAHMLARAGVGHIRLIDFDQVTLSSLNRHVCATLNDVGTPKATCLKKFCEKLCPNPGYFSVEDKVQMYTKENGEQLLDGHDWDMVIDAIDDVPSKAFLIAHCIGKGIKVVSCMGAGGKSDVTRLHVADLRTATCDPLASKLRQSLKVVIKNDSTYSEDMEKLTVVYSSEKAVVKLADFTEEQKLEGVHKFGAVEGMRIRILPVLGTMPAVMGQTLATIALCKMGNTIFSPVTGEKIGRNVRNKLLQHLKRREVKIKDKIELATNAKPANEGEREGRVLNGTWVGPVQIDTDDVEHILEIWRNRCGITGDRLGTVLELVRWNLSKPSVCQNLVVMGSKALKKFDECGKDSMSIYIQQTIENRLRSCRVDSYS